MIAAPVPVVDVIRVWPYVHEWIARACARGDHHWHPLSVMEACARGRCALWLVMDGDDVLGVGVTEVERWPNGDTVGVILLVGGRGGIAWLGLIKTLEEWARLWGCRRMIVRGRRGWLRLLTDYRLAEWTPASLTLSKELT